MTPLVTVRKSMRNRGEARASVRLSPGRRADARHRLAQPRRGLGPVRTAGDVFGRGVCCGHGQFQVFGGTFFQGWFGGDLQCIAGDRVSALSAFFRFFGLVEGILVGCCSGLFGSVRIGTKRFAGLSRCARWLDGVRGRTGLWLGVELTLASPFKRSCVLMITWLGKIGAEAQGLVRGWPSRAFCVNRS